MTQSAARSRGAALRAGVGLRAGTTGQAALEVAAGLMARHRVAVPVWHPSRSVCLSQPFLRESALASWTVACGNSCGP